MKNNLKFYTKLISSILDSCCSYIVILENSDIKLISFYGNKPFNLDTLKLVINNFDPTKKSFSVIDVNEFKNEIKNENFNSKNLNSIGYLPILDENKITIGYLITTFNKPFNILKSQEKTVSIISHKIAEKLRKNKSITTKDLNSPKSPDFKLNLTKEILKKTFKFSNDIFCIVNKDQEFEFVSNASYNIWGYTPEEMIGNPFKNYIVEEDILESLQIEHQAKNNVEISLFENRYLHKNGTIRNMLWSVNWDEESELSYCIAKDVTNFKEIIKKSDENENLLLEAQQLARMGSWNFDFKDDKLTWSDGLYTIFGVDKDLFLETHGSFIDFIIPEDRDFVLQTSKNTQETGEPFNIEYRIKTPSGEQRFVEEFGYSEKDATGKIIRLFGTAQDITERKKSELLLQDSNNKYKYLFENNPLPLFIWDFETLEIIDCNIESLMLYGYTREEFLQLTIKDIRPKEDIDLIIKVTENESIYGEIHKKGWRHLKKNGDLMYVEITAHLLEYNNRRCSLVFIKDITENIELEKKQKEHVQFIETTLENLPIGIAVNKIDDGSATLMNSKFHEIYGWPKQDLTDVATFFEKVYPDVEYREKIVHQVIRDMSSKDPERMNWEGITITTQNGTKKIINAKNIPIYDQNLMISTVVDVTEKFTIQKSLQQSNERYHYATQATSDAIWDWDFENNVVYRADGFKTIFGFDMEELNLPNTSWENYIHPNDRHSVTKSIHDKINSSGNYWKQDYRIIKPNGQVAFVQDSAYIIRGENNTVTRIIGAIQDVTERKKAEEKFSKASDALQKALNDTNKIMDSSLDLICVVDKEGYFVKVSAACEAILGYKPEELIGKPLINYVYNKDNEKTQITADVVMSGTSIKHFENRYIRKDGSLVPLEWTARWDKNDKLRYGVARDITDRKIAEGKIIESENRMRLVTSSAAMGIWYWDVKNDNIVWDKRMYQIYDINDSQLGSVYEGWLSRLHPEDKDRANEVMQTAIADKKREYSSEFRILWDDLSVHYIKVTGITEYDDNGNVIQMMGVNWDVTVEKEKEQHLKLLESVVTNTNDSVLITEAEPIDEPGPRILYVNDAFTKMTGYTPEEVIGKSPRILQGPKSDKVELARIRKALQNWESCEATIINYKKNGEEFWINFTLSPVADEKGWFTHWIAIERDVTLRKNEELQNELIADISTGFSEPLKLPETVNRTLRYIANFGDFCFAEAWLASSDQNILKKISSHAATENMSLFIEETKSIDTFIYGEGFTGVIAKTKEITIWGDLANQKLLRRRDAALKYGLKTLIGLPLLYNNEVIGVLAFGLDYEVINTTKYLTLFKKIGDYLSPEIKRKQLELELNQMFNFAPDLIVIIGLDGCFNRVNPAACKLLGYTQEELCAEPYAHFIHPEDREKSTNEVATLLETHLAHYFENRYITKSGKIKWLAWNAIYVNEDNNIYAVAKDITEKKELEDLLQKANELARIGGWEVDLQTNNVFWSDITKQIHEVAQDYIPVIKTGIAFYKKGGNRTKITKYITQAINTGKSWDEEFQIVTAKGNERWVRAIGEAEFVNGNCVRIYGSFQDIDERKKAESKLIENENYLRTILDNEPECVKVLNSKGELLSMNPAGLAMIEADNEQQVLGHRMTDLVNKKYQIGFKQLSAAVFKGNPGTFEFEITGLKGGCRWMETHAVPLKDTTGKIVNLLGVTRDITERKANENKLILLNENLKKQKTALVTSNKELEQFAYVASHDLQEPLRMVTSFLTLLEKRYNDVLDEKGLKYINFAVDGAKRMRQIILDILEFSRLTNHEENYELIDLKDIIKDVSLLQSKLIKEKKAKIIFEELPKVYSIRHFLIQLFQNIISNALKYSQEDVPLQIIIKSKEYNNYYQIAISDNGIGIEEEYYEKIFIIFQRLHGKEKYQGNGMGLAIAKKIVDKLNGKIWVKSQVGIGSTFYITIPKK